MHDHGKTHIKVPMPPEAPAPATPPDRPPAAAPPKPMPPERLLLLEMDEVADSVTTWPGVTATPDWPMALLLLLVVAPCRPVPNVMAPAAPPETDDEFDVALPPPNVNEPALAAVAQRMAAVRAAILMVFMVVLLSIKSETKEGGAFEHGVSSIFRIVTLK